MRLPLFIAFAAVPLLEIALLVKLGQWIGFWPTMAVIVTTALVGTFVLHRQGFAVMERTMAAVSAGKPPIAPVLDGGFLLLAGFMLIMPGLITDSIGLIMLIPWVRHRIAAGLVRRVLRSPAFKAAAASHPPHGPTTNGARPPPDAGPVIEGEFERLDERFVDRKRSRPNGDGTKP